MSDATPDSGADARRPRIFISYSRRDLAFADRLAQALDPRGFTPIIDRRDIAAFEDWWKRLETLVVQADAVVFVLSPSSVDPDSICLRELAFAQSLNKRLAPIVWRRVEDEEVPDPLRRLNWIDFQDEARFNDNVAQLAAALETDIEWIRKHTELGEAAQRWHVAGRPGPHGLLLRPPLLTDAEDWIGRHPHGAPEPTEAIRAYVASSRTAFDQEETVEVAKQLKLLAQAAESELLRNNMATALRLSVHAVQRAETLEANSPVRSLASATLAAAVWRTDWDIALSTPGELAVALHFGPDGARVVTSSEEGPARLWDVASGCVLAVLHGHEAWVRRAAFSPDGQRIVTASRDKTARVWDSSGREIAVLRGHEAGLWTAAFSLDGSRVITSGADATVRIWDPANGKQLDALREADKEISFAIYSPDGRHILTSAGGAVNVWDVRQNKKKPVTVNMWCAEFNPDATRVAAGSHKSLMICDWERDKLIWQLPEAHDKPITSVRYSRDGTRLVTASDDGTVRIWDAANGKELRVVRGHDAAVVAAAFSPDGTRVVSAAGDETVRVWHTSNNRTIVNFENWHRGRGITSARFSPDGKRVVTTASSGPAYVWDAASGKVVARLDPLWKSRSHDEPHICNAIFSRDGARVLASEGREPYLWDATTGQQLVRFMGHEDLVRSTVFSPDESQILSASADGTACLWRPTGARIAILRGHERTVSSAVFSPDGARILTASGKLVRLWSVANVVEPATILEHDDVVYVAAFTPGGACVATLANDGVVRFWDPTSGRQLPRNRIFHEDMDLLVFSPDGSRLLTRGPINMGRVWNMAGGAEVALLQGHRDAVICAEFSADGSRVVTGSSDATARIWDVDSGREIAVLAGHSGRVASVAFSPDGLRVVTAADDYAARVWDVRTAMMSARELVKDVCSRRLRGLTTLTHEEMHLAGYRDGHPPIDVCAGLP